ncbi:MAG: hypothetical protein VYE18_05905 [Pseudomonadota bacterium]|nr:hypothetical protein [Pseudomonadota bacterium]
MGSLFYRNRMGCDFQFPVFDGFSLGIKDPDQIFQAIRIDVFIFPLARMEALVQIDGRNGLIVERRSDRQILADLKIPGQLDLILDDNFGR